MYLKFAYVGFAFKHHLNTHAGYHQIEKYLPYDKIFDVQKFHFRNTCRTNIIIRAIRRIVRFVFGFNVIPWFVLDLVRYGRKNPNTVFHFVYGENILNNIKPLLNSNNKIVCTFHQPYEWFERNPRFIKLIKCLDSVILVSNAEIDKFATLIGKDKVHYIPHGICTDFYKPNPSVFKEHMLLTVGDWLRDYKFANKVYQKLLNVDTKLQINIVSLPKNKSLITPHERIHFYSGISDEELRSLYYRCSVLFLPLIRFTANNALLEAAATGCTIVISSNNFDNSYIPENFITQSCMDVTETVKKIQESISTNYNQSLADYVKDHYSWNEVANQTLNLLSKL